MNYFKTGDKVRLVDNTEYEFLERGTEYTVSRVKNGQDGDTALVFVEERRDFGMYAYRFELVKETKNPFQVGDELEPSHRRSYGFNYTVIATHGPEHVDIAVPSNVVNGYRHTYWHQHVSQFRLVRRAEPKLEPNTSTRLQQLKDALELARLERDEARDALASCVSSRDALKDTLNKRLAAAEKDADFYKAEWGKTKSDLATLKHRLKDLTCAAQEFLSDKTRYSPDGRS